MTIRNGRGREYRDIEYPAYLVSLELDGRIYHENAIQRDLDLDRDLDAAVAGQAAVRLGWGHVFGRPCRTADRVAALLSATGWAGYPTSCGPDCAVSRAA